MKTFLDSAPDWEHLQLPLRLARWLYVTVREGAGLVKWGDSLSDGRSEKW